MERFTFKEWIDTRRPPNTPMGDFIKDAQRDTSFPRIFSLEELTSYLSEQTGICDEALEASQTAWKKYKKALGQGHTIKQIKAFAKKRFERQMQDAKNNGIPVFECEKLGNSIEFDCPYCLTKHRHGAEGGNLKSYELTHRLAHCYGDTPFKKTGYYIYYK